MRRTAPPAVVIWGESQRYTQASHYRFCTAPCTRYARNCTHAQKTKGPLMSSYAEAVARTNPSAVIWGAVVQNGGRPRDPERSKRVTCGGDASTVPLASISWRVIFSPRRRVLCLRKGVPSEFLRRVLLNPLGLTYVWCTSANTTAESSVFRFYFSLF